MPKEVTFKTFVKIELLKANMTQKQLAEKIGISPENFPSTVHKNPKLSTILKVLKALDLDLTLANNFKIVE